MSTQVERAKRIIEKSVRKDNLANMIEQIRRAQKNDSLPLKLYYKRGDGQTIMCTANPIGPAT